MSKTPKGNESTSSELRSFLLEAPSLSTERIKTLWGLPVVVREEPFPPREEPPPRMIRSDDLIEGVLQLLDGKLTMEVVDKDDGKRYRVRIVLDPIEEADNALANNRGSI
jgi:hypothetical protein